MTYESVIVALADPTRRSILEMLKEGPRAVGELAGDLPVTRAAVSQHLRVLKEAHLVSETAQGTRRIYRAEPAGLSELRKYLDGFWGDVLEAFAAEAESARPLAKKRRKERRR